MGDVCPANCTPSRRLKIARICWLSGSLDSVTLITSLPSRLWLLISGLTCPMRPLDAYRPMGERISIGLLLASGCSFRVRDPRSTCWVSREPLEACRACRPMCECPPRARRPPHPRERSSSPQDDQARFSPDRRNSDGSRKSHLYGRYTSSSGRCKRTHQESELWEMPALRTARLPVASR